MTRSIGTRLSAACDQAFADAWQPRLFDLSQDADCAGLETLLDSGAVRFVHDTLGQQLAGLLETREPQRKLSAAELSQRAERHLDGRPSHLHGRWVHYPWSGRLVHVLPEAEFRELRTSRNRNKITFEEQEKLRRMRIGIVGLSVGQAAAITLTLEEVGGSLQLADFDYLELSNLNRLRAGVHELGINKAVLAARAVHELNPYARVAIFPAGVTPENIDAFLASGPFGKLDLVFEECDDLEAKVLVRERSRAHRIPVLMETSDRGLMDVERFDLEPERPIFHGLVGEVKAAELRGLSTYDKVPLVLRIMDQRGISDRMAASMVDIESTLKSWPQLASEVALGSGINVDVARRIGLGQFTKSGRFYLDIAGTINDEKAVPVELPVEEEPVANPETQRSDLPPLVAVHGAMTQDQVRTLLAYATTAFSGGNCQPWHFTADGNRLRCRHVVEKSKSMLDFRHHASYLAFGSVVESLDLAARAMRLSPEFRFAPVPEDPNVVFDVHLIPGLAVAPDPLAAQLGPRETNRKLGKRVPLEPEAKAAMIAAAEQRGARLQVIDTEDGLEAMGEILGRAELLRLVSPVMHQEMMHEIRWTREEVERTRDGFDIATLEFSAPDLAGMRLVSSWRVMKMVGSIGGGWGLQRPARKAIAASSAVALVTMPGIDCAAFLKGGRAVQRIWLTTTALGLAFQPMTPITYLFDRLEHGDAEGLSPEETTELREIRRLYRQHFEVPEGHCEPMLFRVGRGGRTSGRALRRHVEDVVTFGPIT